MSSVDPLVNGNGSGGGGTPAPTPPGTPASIDPPAAATPTPPRPTVYRDERARRRAFEEQMLPHLDALYRTAFAMTKNSGDADDLVQDAYLRAYQFFDQFQGGTNARAWLFRIMTNLYINSYRRRTREPERVSYDELEDFYLYNRLADGQSRGVSASPEEEVVQKVEIEAVRAAIERLPDEYRDTVILADLNEFSYQEIADMLQIPIGTVRSRLSRGRRLVQKALWAYSEENTR
jgi:RNA polymerase sigma-70 factor (ECF subfamily)